MSSVTELESKFLGFFVTYFLVDYKSINSILEIFFGDSLEMLSYFNMCVVYVCALLTLFKSFMIVKILWSNTLICVVVIKAPAIVTES